jgi:hypothetical protein
MGIKNIEHIIEYTYEDYDNNEDYDYEDEEYPNFSYENPGDLEDLVIVKYFEQNLVTIDFVVEYMFHYLEYLKEQELYSLNSLVYFTDKQDFINESIKIIENFKDKLLDNCNYSSFGACWDNERRLIFITTI